MILTIGPNPSLETTVAVPNFEPGRVFRLTEKIRFAGSKGFNFARALRTLGQTTLVISPLAGQIGRLVQQLAEAEGLTGEYIWIAGETRTILNIVDPVTRRVTEFIENGPVVPAADWEKLVAAIKRRLPEAQWLVMCGSFLPGTPLDGPRTLLEAANAVGVPTLFDTYGPSLAQAISARPFVVKINQHEAGDLLGRAVKTPAEAMAATADIQARGAQAVIITLGPQGAVGIDPAGQTFAWAAPQVASLCATGSGDALLAGLVAGLVRGEPFRAAARLGIAAGTANTLQIGPAIFEAAQAAALLDQVKELPI